MFLIFILLKHLNVYHFPQSFNLDNKDGFGYSSVHVSSYADDGSGQPKVFQASKSTKVAPGGVGYIQVSIVQFWFYIKICLNVKSWFVPYC